MKITKKICTAALSTLSLLLVLTACQKSSLEPGKKIAAVDQSQQVLANPYVTFGDASTDSIFIHQNDRTAAFADDITASNIALVYLKGFLFSVSSDPGVVFTKAKVKIGADAIPSQTTISDSVIAFTFNRPVPLVGSGPFHLSMSVIGTGPSGARSQVTLQRVAAFDSLGTRLSDVRNLPQKGYRMNFVTP